MSTAEHGWWRGLAGLTLALLVIAGCGQEAPQRVVVIYTAVDQPVAEPILKEFERTTGIRLEIRYDAEQTKTAGLAHRLEAEKDNPRADVWWSNEVFHTIALANKGILAPYESPAAANIPAKYKDKRHRWAATALRARVIGVHTQLPEGVRITGLRDLENPALKGKIAMAMPAAGTTSGHVAAMYALWGPQEFERYMAALRDNQMKLLGGNAVVAEHVGRGVLLAGLTDNDDVSATLKNGGKIVQVLPDQGDGGIGTLAIPCSVGLVAGRANDDAKRLVDYLLSPQVEAKMLEAKFAGYSVFAAEGELAVKTMAVDYADVSAAMPVAVETALRILQGR